MAIKNIVRCVVGVCVFLSSSISAQDEFERVQVLDHPRYSLNKRFAIDAELGFLPLDAYYKPILMETAVSYQFTDLFSWEIGRFGFSVHNYDTGLVGSIRSGTGFNVSAGDQRLKDLKYRVGSAAFLNLLYSKSNFFNKSIIYHYWQVGAGVTYFDMDLKKQYGIDLTMRARFILTENVMFNFRFGHFMGFASGAPKNISSLGIGAGFAL